MNDKIVMSDGTNILYFMNLRCLQLFHRIEVYDNEKKVDSAK